MVKRRQAFSQLAYASGLHQSSPEPGSPDIPQPNAPLRAPVPPPARDPLLRKPRAAPRP